MLAPLPQSPLPNFIPDLTQVAINAGIPASSIQATSIPTWLPYTSPHPIVWESESGPSISYLSTAINLSNKMPLAATQKLSQTLRVPKADKNFDPACIDI